MIDAFTWVKFDLKKVESDDAVAPKLHLHTVICADTASNLHSTRWWFFKIFSLTRTMDVFGALLALLVVCKI